MERFHCCCVCSAKNILASEKCKHAIKDSWKQDWKQAAQFHTANFWQTFNSFCCFACKHIYLCDVTRFSEGGSQNKLGLTVSYSLPASQHMLLLYKGFLETKCALKIHRLYALLKATKEKCLWKKCVCNNSTISVLANPSALQSSSFRKSEVRKRLRTHSQVCRPRCHNGHLSVMLKHFTLQTF